MHLFHEPVLQEEVLQAFQGKSMKLFFDGTIGNGGHATAILNDHPEIDTYFACDVDPKAINLAKKQLAPWKDKVHFIHGNFSDIDQYLDENNTPNIDGCLFDIGVSSMQLDDESRGFSFMREGPLDMRMNPHISITAEEIINTFSEKKLAEIFRLYGEEPQSKKAARLIAAMRRKKRFTTTRQLAELLEKQLRRKRKLHPATLIFQALRIYINDEIHVLKQALVKAVERLNSGGRIAVISFHSLEDREVKQLFKSQSMGSLKLITKKPLVAKKEEMRKNPRSRSAKLRIAEKR